MTLKPSYLRAFIKTFLCFFVFIAIVSGIIPYFQGKQVQAGDILGEAGFGAVFFGIFVALAFTPREITWNDDTITIRTLFPGSGDFEWRQLEAWSPCGRGTFLIKFEDKQAFQIAPAGFRREDWKAFRAFLKQRFPEKKRLFWLGVSPIRLGK